MVIYNNIMCNFIPNNEHYLERARNIRNQLLNRTHQTVNFNVNGSGDESSRKPQIPAQITSYI